MSFHKRRYVVHLTNGETIEPDNCLTKDNGWLNCTWLGDEQRHRKYPPSAVAFYESLPSEDGN